jgi:hypothetical protein
MRTDVPEKVLQIARDVAEKGSANVTRLTVLKKWFKRPERLTAFAVWIAGRAAARKGKTTGDAGKLFTESRTLLKGLDRLRPKPNRAAVKKLHARLRDFQNEYKSTQYGMVRLVTNWNLLIVEKGLAIWLDGGTSPADGYAVAADYSRHYDPRYPELLTAGSIPKLEEIVRFMFTIEALEDEP